MIRTHLFSLIFLGIISLDVAVKFEKKPLDKAQCSWERVRCANGAWDFNVNCTTRQMSYGCKYEGNPSKCSWYQTTGNPDIFYKELAEEAAIDQRTACSRDCLVNNKHCQDVIFKKAAKSLQPISREKGKRRPT
ncbi:hypothetical protein ACJMK2_031897 [Sinanodonta woodiana]|uniref:Secreted protein n=1 Tax=Sinanodonta woodiana TaxID=1069815 RepID=A0ABD3X042_SINWO